MEPSNPLSPLDLAIFGAAVVPAASLEKARFGGSPRQLLVLAEGNPGLRRNRPTEQPWRTQPDADLPADETLRSLGTAAARCPGDRSVYIYRSCAERMESAADVAHDNRLRKAHGEPGRDIVREPARRHGGPWYNFKPFPDEADAEPYAVIQATHPVVAVKGRYDEYLACVSTGSGTLDMVPSELMGIAIAGRFGLRVIGGPLAEEAGEQAEQARGDAERYKAEQAAQRLAAIEAEAARRAVTLAAPTPSIGSIVLLWNRQVIGAGHHGATERLFPTPAIVHLVSPRSPNQPPPPVSVVAFGSGGGIPHDRIPFSAEPREGCWSWPVGPESLKAERIADDARTT